MDVLHRTLHDVLCILKSVVIGSEHLGTDLQVKQPDRVLELG